MNQVICYDCGIRRRIVAPVIDEARRIVGFRCRKCVQKLYVGGGRKVREMGQGWRRAFMDLVTQIRDAQEKKARAQHTPVAQVQPVAVVKPKKTLVNKIASFFRRTP